MTATPELKNRAYSREEVVAIIRSALGSLNKTDSGSSKLHAELTDLAKYIDSMRLELAQLRGVEINSDHIPTATEELNAVVDETAKATGKIMDACEKIEKTSTVLPAPIKDSLSQNVTEIYEACSFQDITGQRIKKVVKTLINIETKVKDIIGAFGPQNGVATAATRTEQKISVDDPKSLLNGPQLKGEAASQADIDKLLSSFD